VGRRVRPPRGGHSDVFLLNRAAGGSGTRGSRLSIGVGGSHILDQIGTWTARPNCAARWVTCGRKIGVRIHSKVVRHAVPPPSLAGGTPWALGRLGPHGTSSEAQRPATGAPWPRCPDGGAPWGAPAMAPAAKRATRGRATPGEQASAWRAAAMPTFAGPTPRPWSAAATPVRRPLAP